MSLEELLKNFKNDEHICLTKKNTLCFCEPGFFKEFKKCFDHCANLYNISTGDDDLYGPWENINGDEKNVCLLFISTIEQCIEDGTMFIFGDALMCLQGGKIGNHIHKAYKGKYDSLFWPKKGYVEPSINDLEKEHIFNSFIMEIARQRTKEEMTIEESLEAFEWIIKENRRKHKIPFKFPEN